MNKIFNSILLAVCLSTNTACISSAIEAAIPQKGKQEDRVKQVRSIAIVAFDSLMYVPGGIANHVGSVGTFNTMANLTEVESGEVKTLYSTLQNTLASKGYKVISLDAVTANAIYRKMMPEKKGKIAEKELSNDSKPHSIKGLLRAANPTYMFTQADIQELKKSLGVDAIVTGRLRYSSHTTSSFSTGFNSRYLGATFMFHMFDGSQENPIWFDYGFVGPIATESIGRVYGHEDTAMIAEQTIPVGTNAINAFF